MCQLIRKSLSGWRLWKAGGTQNLLIGSGAARGAHSGPAPDVNPVSGGTDAEVTELQGLEGTVAFGDPTRLPRECGQASGLRQSVAGARRAFRKRADQAFAKDHAVCYEGSGNRGQRSFWAVRCCGTRTSGINGNLVGASQVGPESANLPGHAFFSGSRRARQEVLRSLGQAVSEIVKDDPGQFAQDLAVPAVFSTS